VLNPTAPDFSDPLGLLAACHQRIREHCKLLDRILDWIPAHGADTEVQAAARQVLRYFETAAPHHHADEEEDLFPLLEGDAELARLIAQLRGEHGRLDAQWADLAPRLQRLSRGEVPERLAPAVDAFSAACGTHIDSEDAHILPAAQRLLDPAQLATLGHAMARRRRVTSTAGD